MTLSSPECKGMEPLPLKYTETGTRPSIVVSPGMNNAAVNPPIEWSNAPPGTNAFVLMLYDHVDTLMWAVVNIPGDVRSLPEAIPNGNQSSKLPAGAFHRSFRSNGWIGPAARQNPEGRWTYYWKAADEYSRIDYLLVSPALVKEIIPEKCGINDSPFWNEASDHRAIFATVSPVNEI
jgi:hypothetical protein